jgi:hypothetical protein
VRCFSHAVLFVPHHKNNNFTSLFSSALRILGIQKKKNRHDWHFFSSELNLPAPLHFPLGPCHNAAPPTTQRGPAPFHTSAFAWAIPPFRLLRSCLQQENVLPKEGK